MLVGPNEQSFESFRKTLTEEPEVRVTAIGSGASALEKAASDRPDLVVADKDLGDMSGLALIGRLLHVNAMIYTAVVSDLSAEDFHEAGEGLGILAQLPPNPGRAEALSVVEKLKKLTRMTIPAAG